MLPYGGHVQTVYSKYRTVDYVHDNVHGNLLLGAPFGSPYILARRTRALVLYVVLALRVGLTEKRRAKRSTSHEEKGLLRICIRKGSIAIVDRSGLPGSSDPWDV